MNKGTWTSSGHFFLQAEADIQVAKNSRGLGNVNKGQGDPYDFRSQVKYYWWVDARKYNNNIQEDDDDMTQDKFNEMFKTAMSAYRQDLRDNDSGSWSKEAREYAVSSGLFAGSGTTPDGQPNFMWEDLLTREQCAQLFYRFAQQHGLT